MNTFKNWKENCQVVKFCRKYCHWQFLFTMDYFLVCMCLTWNMMQWIYIFFPEKKKNVKFANGQSKTYKFCADSFSGARKKMCYMSFAENAQNCEVAALRQHDRQTAQFWIRSGILFSVPLWFWWCACSNECEQFFNWTRNTESAFSNLFFCSITREMYNQWISMHMRK